MQFSISRIDFLEEAREKWANDEPSHPLEPSKPTKPTDPVKPTKPKENIITRGFSKLMYWLGKICS